MGIFDESEIGESVFGLVQGHMTIVDIVPKERRIEGFAAITCKDKNGKLFHYTIDGLPGWALGYCNCRTLYRVEDIDLTEIDMSSCSEILSEKKIMKLIDNGDDLEFRCPSGIWIDIDNCPEKLINKALKKSSWHLFRKSQIKN